MILPLLAMHDEYRMRAKRHGLSCTTWTVGSEPAASPQIVLVAVESCEWDGVKTYITTLIRTGRLARIAVDEAHLLLQQASFRPCLDVLEYFGQMPTSIILMTATCPRHMEGRLFEKVGRKVYRVLRRDTDRPEIAQQMVHLPPTDIEKTVADKISLLTGDFSRKDRALLFCWSRDECDAMAALLRWKPYHSGISVEERLRNKQQWTEGDVVGLVCTSMLNCCLDFPSVRCVFHLGPPRDGTDYYQAIGRCGRDGLPAYSIVYFHDTGLRKIKSSIGNDLFGVKVMYDTLCDSSTCRRLRFGTFFDGVATPCMMIPGAQLCDVCKAQLTEEPPTAPMPFPDHLLLDYCTPVSHVSDQHLGNGRQLIPTNWVTKQHTSAPTPQPTNSLASIPSNPANHPAPSGTFGNHLLAAQASIKHSDTSPSNLHRRSIHKAVQILSNCCPYCWSRGTKCDTHRLHECVPYTTQHLPSWKAWKRHLKFPAGCCFFCGCPLKVNWISCAPKLLTHLAGDR